MVRLALACHECAMDMCVKRVLSSFSLVFLSLALTLLSLTHTKVGSRG